MKVRRVTKNVCKLHTKRLRLPVNKVAQHEKKYLLNCSVRVHQRIIKVKETVFLGVIMDWKLEI